MLKGRKGYIRTFWGPLLVVGLTALFGFMVARALTYISEVNPKTETVILISTHFDVLPNRSSPIHAYLDVRPT